ncbi:MAG: AmmeMemoRadiSam system protein A [Firmicutes bacterium]|nr:AmmeMemoRadiSam system protein A [Bacillota bacterium]
MNTKVCGEVVMGALTPHPALLIPEIGKEALAKVKSTVMAMQRLARAVKELEPDVVIVVSPHGPLLADGIGVRSEKVLQGDFGQFGASHIKLNFTNDLELFETLFDIGKTKDYPLREVNSSGGKNSGWPPELDYATLVPLYYLQEAGVRASLLSVGVGFLSIPQLYEFGRLLRQAVENSRRRAVVIASGDLSHRLTEDAPGGYSPVGRLFDEKLWHLLENADVKGLLNLDDAFIREAGECGYRPLVMILGCWESCKLAALPLSYEGPFGVGYGVCALYSTDGDVYERLVSSLTQGAGSDSEGQFLVQLARNTVEATAKNLPPPTPTLDDLPLGLPKRAGVFVSIEKCGMLRGCIGTIRPTQPNILEEVVYAAGQAASRDPRFQPVVPGELAALTYSVDVLGCPEKVTDVDELDPKRFGVIVESGGREGLLLPDLEGIQTGAEQLTVAKNKAGIKPHDMTNIYRFEVKRFQEE